MTRMLTTDELTAMFEQDDASIEQTVERLEAVGLTLEEATRIWKMLAGSADPVKAGMAGVSFMAALLVAETHRKLMRCEDDQVAVDHGDAPARTVRGLVSAVRQNLWGAGADLYSAKLLLERKGACEELGEALERLEGHLRRIDHKVTIAMEAASNG